MCLLAPTLGGAVASAQNAPSDEALREQIELRDQLIAAQESLLNSYRCRFDIDTHVVQGGCTDGTPTGGPIQPTPFDGAPTQPALDVRDRLIENQEALLNVYRCLFNVDTQIVPGGCGESAPENPFTSVSFNRGHGCGIRADETISCWGANTYGESVSPLGQYSAVFPDGLYTCALTVHQLIECWGGKITDAPNGTFATLGTSSNHACALSTDQTIACWGNTRYDQPIPDGSFTQISVGNSHACGIRTDQTIACWGHDWDGRLGEPPTETFNSVSVGYFNACGIKTNQTIACWGRSHDPGILNAPSGAFSALARGAHHICGLRTNGFVSCWGCRPRGRPAGRRRRVLRGPRCRWR